jgi:hypothetical protein
LASNPDGSPYLELRDASKEASVTLGMQYLTFRDSSGKPRVSIDVLPDGSAAMTLSDDSAVRASLTVAPDGAAGLAVFDGQRNIKGALYVHGDGTSIRIP